MRRLLLRLSDERVFVPTSLSAVPQSTWFASHSCLVTTLHSLSRLVIFLASPSSIMVLSWEQRIVDPGIAGGQRALDEHHGAGLPDLQHGHPVDRRCRTGSRRMNPPARR